ncbi:sigma factor [Dactylosporangium sp. NPDC049742]|uniref:sigma factor n=1 Tax=Dactylosporangium sp. NPDC049742 TaxID=3154737 RepID=UPI00342806A7
MSEPADEALAQFVRARGASLMRYGFLLSGNEADAADLLQDALIGLRGKWSRIRQQDAVEAYVRRSMARQYIRIWRRRSGTCAPGWSARTPGTRSGSRSRARCSGPRPATR